jgi:hypothetical protein
LTSQAFTGIHSKLYIYVLIFAVMLLPVVLWPVAEMCSFQLTQSAIVGHKWFLYTAVVIVIVVITDSILSVERTILERLLWVVAIVGGMAYEMFVSGSFYVMGSMFAFHSMRSAALLWRGTDDWWLWPAWIRDSGTAIVLYLWLAEASV